MLFISKNVVVLIEPTQPSEAKAKETVEEESFISRTSFSLLLVDFTYASSSMQEEGGFMESHHLLPELNAQNRRRNLDGSLISSQRDDTYEAGMMLTRLLHFYCPSKKQQEEQHDDICTWVQPVVTAMMGPYRGIWSDAMLLELLALLATEYSSYQQTSVLPDRKSVPLDNENTPSSYPWHLASSLPSLSAPTVLTSQSLSFRDDALVFSSIDEEFTLYPLQDTINVDIDFSTVLDLDPTWHKLVGYATLVNATILSLSSPIGYYCMTAASVQGGVRQCDVMGAGEGSEIPSYVKQISANYRGVFDNIAYLTEQDTPLDMYDIIIGKGEA